MPIPVALGGERCQHDQRKTRIGPGVSVSRPMTAAARFAKRSLSGRPAAIEADAGQALPGLRQSLAEAKAGRVIAYDPKDKSKTVFYAVAGLGLVFTWIVSRSRTLGRW